MDASRLPVSHRSGSLFPDEPKPSFRTKTAATRSTPAELTEIESAARSCAKTNVSQIAPAAGDSRRSSTDRMFSKAHSKPVSAR
jgi:hypothetical protein